MPKQLVEIRNFNNGTLLTPDSTDISLDAASYSLNIDSVTESGKLKGINEDYQLELTDMNGNTISPLNGLITELEINGIMHYVILTSDGWKAASIANEPQAQNNNIGQDVNNQGGVVNG